MSQDPLREHCGTWALRWQSVGTLGCSDGYQWAMKTGFWEEAKLTEP